MLTGAPCAAAAAAVPRVIDTDDHRIYARLHYSLTASQGARSSTRMNDPKVARDPIRQVHSVHATGRKVKKEECGVFQVGRGKTDAWSPAMQRKVVKVQLLCLRRLCVCV